jgi:hypothetical protein
MKEIRFIYPTLYILGNDQAVPLTQFLIRIAFKFLSQVGQLGFKLRIGTSSTRLRRGSSGGFEVRSPGYKNVFDHVVGRKVVEVSPHGSPLVAIDIQ